MEYQPLRSLEQGTALIRVMEQSASIRTHYQLLLWLQGEFQEFLPHDIMISVSGDFEKNDLYYDIASAMPGVRTAHLRQCSIQEFCQSVHRRWVGLGGQPVEVDAPDGFAPDHCNRCHHGNHCGLYHAFQQIRHGICHAITDARFKADHLYILLSKDNSSDKRSRQSLSLLLPHLDAAVRKIGNLPDVHPEQIASRSVLNSLLQAGLSPREIEILEWVRNGKTNIEIGMILDISSFTVKNHLQRIFKKMNVTNRAQAVSKVGQSA